MKHTDKMAFYDNMLAELKELRAKTPDRRGRNDLLFIEIVWNYYLYKNFPGQTDGLEHILKSRRFSLTVVRDVFRGWDICRLLRPCILTGPQCIFLPPNA